MESLFVPWQQRGTWHLERSYLTAEGQAVVIELAEAQGAQATLTAFLGPAAGDLEAVWRQLGPPPPVLQREAEAPPRRLFSLSATHVGLLVQGTAGRYLTLIEAPADQLAAWSDFLWTAELRPEPLWQSLQAAGLAVFAGLASPPPPSPLAQPVEAAWTGDARLRALMHPAQPGEVLVRVPAPGGWARAWVRLLEARPGYWLGQRLPDPEAPGDQPVIHLVWDAALQALLQVSPAWLATPAAERPGPCPACGATVRLPGYESAGPCAFCGTEPAQEEASPPAAEPPRPWWARWWH